MKYRRQNKPKEEAELKAYDMVSNVHQGEKHMTILLMLHLSGHEDWREG